MSTMRLACGRCLHAFDAAGITLPMEMAKCAEALKRQRCPRCDADSAQLFLDPAPLVIVEAFNG